LLFLFTVDLFNGPLLELMRRNGTGCACRESGKEERQGAGGRCMVVGGGNLEVDPDEFQVRLRAISIAVPQTPWADLVPATSDIVG
jgi:hypothetical protein